jgi:hypothetical protein
MIDKPRKLSVTTRGLLTAAAARDDHLIQPPRLPAAAARQVVRSLLNAGLAEEIPAPIDDAEYGWREIDGGFGLMLRATEVGLACLRAEGGSSLVPPTALVLVETGVGADDAMPPGPPAAGDTAVDEPQPGLDAAEAPRQPPAAVKLEDATHAPPLAAARLGRRNGLRQAAQALLAARARRSPQALWTSTLPACVPPWLGGQRHLRRPMVHARSEIRSRRAF